LGDGLLKAIYAPRALAEYRRYEARVDRLVEQGDLTEAEGHVRKTWTMAAMTIDGKPIRRATCKNCGAQTIIIGGIADRFNCACSPLVQQSILDSE
jgi:hypothetical protein